MRTTRSVNRPQQIESGDELVRVLPERDRVLVDRQAEVFSDSSW
jgi:hypothetical protein